MLSMTKRPQKNLGPLLCAAGCASTSADTVVVLLSVDLIALLILRLLDASLLSGADVAIRSSSGLLAVDACLAALQV